MNQAIRVEDVINSPITQIVSRQFQGNDLLSKVCSRNAIKVTLVEHRVFELECLDVRLKSKFRQFVEEFVFQSFFK